MYCGQEKERIPIKPVNLRNFCEICDKSYTSINLSAALTHAGDLSADLQYILHLGKFKHNRNQDLLFLSYHTEDVFSITSETASKKYK